jgi:hypothetical protein
MATAALVGVAALAARTGSYATTGSNTFAGGAYFSSSFNPTGFTTTASLYTDGGLRVGRDAYISGTLYSGSHTVTGDSDISGSVDIAGGISIGGSLSSASHTVTGNSNISGTARVGGTTTIIGSLSSGSHTVTGNSRITNRVDTNTIYADTYLNLPTTDTRADIVNHIYPVGSIFLSFTNVNPSVRFTGTTWVQVSQGRFVVGVGTGDDGIQNKVFAAGNTTGEYEHQLTIAEMPSHNHVQTYTGGDRCDRFDCVPFTSGGTNLYPQAGGGQGGYRSGTTMNTAGSNAYHENTPPGFGMYVWQRTALA